MSLSKSSIFLCGEPSNIEAYHQEWAEQIRQNYGICSNSEQAGMIIQRELGQKFTKVLEDAGVFKEKEAFKRFIKILNTPS